MNSEPQIPDWKTPHHLWEKKKVEDAGESKVKDLLPRMAARIGWLDNPDEQLNHLCDYLQENGVPMGSKNWALKAENLFRRLEDERHAAYRILNQWRDKELPDFNRFAADLDHARAMHAKRNPAMEIICDWCGWPGARFIGNGYNAFGDCLPENKYLREVRETILTRLGLNKTDALDDSHLETALRGDSLDRLELVIDLEEKYEIVINDGDAAKWKNIKDIAEYIETRKTEKK